MEDSKIIELYGSYITSVPYDVTDMELVNIWRSFLPQEACSTEYPLSGLGNV